MTAVALGIVFTLAADLLLLLVFRRLHQQAPAPHLREFALAWAVGAGRFALALAGELVGKGPLLSVAVLVLVTAQVAFLLRGTLAFVGRPAPGWLVPALAALGVAVVGLVAVGGPRGRLALIPLFAALGLATISAGAVLLRSTAHSDAEAPFGRNLAGGALVLWGVHRLNFPFLHDHPSFAPVGIAIAGVLELCVAVGMLLLYFQRAMARASSSEARYRSLVDGNSDGLFVARPEGVLEANPAFCRMLGYDLEQLRDLRVPEDLLADPADAERLAARGDELHGVEVVLRRKDGASMRAELRGRSIRDESGALLRYEGSLRDVTYERALAHELEQARRLEALGRVAGGVAHDFNNLLTVILGSVDLIARDDYKEAQSNIREAAQRGAALTQQLLSVGRKQPIKREALDLVGLTAEIRTLLARLIGEHIELVFEHEAAEASIIGDREQLIQALLNLAANARDAMPDGGVLRLGVSHAVPPEEAGAEPGVAWARLTVTDSGEGMSVEVQEHLFEPFFTTKELGKGTGLGLASVYGVVRQAGGHVTVDSRLGAGTSISLWFPPAASCAEPARASQRVTGRRLRDQRGLVLVAEDEPAVRYIVESALRVAGYVVRAFGSGRDLEAAVAASPALLAQATLLLTDVRMPGASGVALADALRAERPDLEVLLMSGNTEGVALPEGVPLLRKPFNVDELVLAVAAQHASRSGEPDAKAAG